MKKKMMSLFMAVAMTACMVAGCGSNTGSNTGDDGQSTGENTTSESSTDGSADNTVYKVGIVQYVDDASLNQIERAIEAELDAKGAELGVTFDYADYTYNGQADSSTLNQIATDLVAENVDVIIPIATPTAMIMQAATEENQIPVVFSAVSDPVGAGLVASLDAPGSNITGTSDALNTEAVFDLMFAANPDIESVGLLYNKSEDASKAPIEEAKAYLDEKGVSYVEKTGTTNDEISLAADALVAAGVDAVFTPTDNTVMTAELAIYEKFLEAKIPHYAGADSFALNGAFCGFGVNYVDLGTATADMVVDILVNSADPATTPVQLMDNGIATVNTDIATEIGLDYSMFESMCAGLVETKTAEEFGE
ncbi:MAG: ABC transporter substrate-binding protein [Lachnospiraceae bacterium]|nr:ABC transporter substrate-binding protein [Lachnospiraceae bacterium]